MSNNPAMEGLFLPYQRRWIEDHSRLKIIEKSRQIGITYADAYDSVRRASAENARLDVWVSSRDEMQAQLYVQQCQRWAELLNIMAIDLGEVVLDPKKGITAYQVRFANGHSIFAVSSNPDALAGKTGHIKLDEFALHQDQQTLFSVAHPCALWGGSLAIISTHRSRDSLFYELLSEIKLKGNPKNFSHHRVSLEDAVSQGLVEKINALSRAEETREKFMARLRAECIDENQWLREFCCTPSDDRDSFLDYDLITPCEETGCLRDLAYLRQCANPLYAGIDVARKQHLCVIDVGEKIGDVVWDRLRIELKDKPFSEIERQLLSILELPNLRRACMDATGLGMQLAENARRRFRWKVEPIHFTAAIKEELAFGLRAAFEDKLLRIASEAALRADLHAITKEVTTAGHIRFSGASQDSHCDRFWAKALRNHAATHKYPTVTASLA